MIAHRGEKAGQRRSDIDRGTLRWAAGQRQMRKQPYFAQAGHQASTVTRKSRTQRRTGPHAGKRLSVGVKEEEKK